MSATGNTTPQEQATQFQVQEWLNSRDDIRLAISHINWQVGYHPGQGLSLGDCRISRSKLCSDGPLEILPRVFLFANATQGNPKNADTLEPMLNLISTVAIKLHELGLVKNEFAVHNSTREILTSDAQDYGNLSKSVLKNAKGEEKPVYTVYKACKDGYITINHYCGYTVKIGATWNTCGVSFPVYSTGCFSMESLKWERPDPKDGKSVTIFGVISTPGSRKRATWTHIMPPTLGVCPWQDAKFTDKDHKILCASEIDLFTMLVGLPETVLSFYKPCLYRCTFAAGEDEVTCEAVYPPVKAVPFFTVPLKYIKCTDGSWLQFAAAAARAPH